MRFWLVEAGECDAGGGGADEAAGSAVRAASPVGSSAPSGPAPSSETSETAGKGALDDWLSRGSTRDTKKSNAYPLAIHRTNM